MFNVGDYLNRLKVKPGKLNLTWLNSLHHAHYKQIPYENFDIINQISFNLNKEYLFEKIITRNRGGYCYELNILFFHLLQELGFPSTLLTAQIFQHDGNIGNKFDHPLILVDLGEQYLADVGNSKWFIKPLKLKYSKVQSQFGSLYSISFQNNIYKLIQQINGDNLNQYQFNLIEVQPLDFNPYCQFKWTSSISKFTQGYIISKCNGSKRIVMKNNSISILKNSKIVNHRISDKETFKYYLNKYFGEHYVDLVTHYKVIEYI